eukprot:14440727-Alexandrium_andersonii.AAC.1
MRRARAALDTPCCTSMRVLTSCQEASPSQARSRSSGGGPKMCRFRRSSAATGGVCRNLGQGLARAGLGVH